MDQAVHILFFDQNHIEQMEMLRLIQEQMQEINTIFRVSPSEKPPPPTKSSSLPKESAPRSVSKAASSNLSEKSGEASNGASGGPKQEYYPFGRYSSEQQANPSIEQSHPNELKLSVQGVGKFGKKNMFSAEANFRFDTMVEEPPLPAEEEE